MRIPMNFGNTSTSRRTKSYSAHQKSLGNKAKLEVLKMFEIFTERQNWPIRFTPAIHAPWRSVHHRVPNLERLVCRQPELFARAIGRVHEQSQGEGKDSVWPAEPVRDAVVEIRWVRLSSAIRNFADTGSPLFQMMKEVREDQL